MSTIIGIRPSSFTGEGGEKVSGKNFYFTSPLKNGEGLGADRVFLLDSRIEKLDYVPSVGDEVEVIYNRFGKCSGFTGVFD